jgi:hypothetical protein
MKDRAAKTAEPLRRTLDTAADLYDAARPSYPDTLYDDLVGGTRHCANQTLLAAEPLSVG